ncbi:MAG: hypothetical protein ACRELD_14310 [Longimicrobiales bacterium]
MTRLGALLARVAVVVSIAWADAAPAAAQDWRFDLGLYGGAARYSAALDDAALGAAAPSLSFGSGWQLGTHLAWWPQPRLGLRLNGGFAERALRQGVVIRAGDINLWDLTGDLLIRLPALPSDWFDTEVLPYVAAGTGLKHLNPATNVEVDDGQADGIIVYPDGATGTTPAFFLSRSNRLQFLAAVGTDLRVGSGVGFRLEIGDRIWKTPIHRLEEGAAAMRGEDVGERVHQLFASLGLQVTLGVSRPTEVVTRATRQPEQNISVCVVDPGTDFGISDVDALYVPDTRDTVVLIYDQRLPLSAALASVMVAPQADWYVAGRDLVIAVGDRAMRFAARGGARQIAAEDLAYLGDVDGLPVYASRVETPDLRQLLARDRRARNTNELVDVLAQDPDLEARFAQIDLLYVPLQATHCIFQGLERASAPAPDTLQHR